MNRLNRMYELELDNLDTEEERRLRKDLILKPKKFDQYAFGEKEDLVLLEQDIPKNQWLIPRWYGIDRYGTYDDMTYSEKVDLKFKGRLREKQVEPYNRFLKKWKQHNFHGIFQGTPGWGKTILGIRLAVDVGEKTLILVHKGDLLKQWVDHAKRFLGIEAGVVQQDNCDSDAPFAVGMLQSIARRDYPIQAGFVCFDEVQHLPAASFWAAITKLNPRYLLGLSGTARRTDGLENAFLYHIGPILETVKSGIKATAYIFPVPSYIDSKKYVRRIKGKNRINLARMITDLTLQDQRNKVMILQMLKAQKKGRKFLALSDRREHLQILQKMFVDKGGKDSSLYMGGMKKKEIDEAQDKLALFGTFSFGGEGTDWPLIDCVFLCSPKADVEQSIGRGLRELADKKELIIVDFLDTSHSLLKGYCKKRCSIYNRLGFEVNELSITPPRTARFVTEEEHAE